MFWISKNVYRNGLDYTVQFVLVDGATQPRIFCSRSFDLAMSCSTTTPQRWSRTRRVAFRCVCCPGKYVPLQHGTSTVTKPCSYRTVVEQPILWFPGRRIAASATRRVETRPNRFLSGGSGACVRKGLAVAHRVVSSFSGDDDD